MPGTRKINPDFKAVTMLFSRANLAFLTYAILPFQIALVRYILQNYLNNDPTDDPTDGAELTYPATSVRFGFFRFELSTSALETINRTSVRFRFFLWKPSIVVIVPFASGSAAEYHLFACASLSVKILES